MKNMKRLVYDHVSKDNISDSTKAILCVINKSGDDMTYTDIGKCADRREMGCW